MLAWFNQNKNMHISKISLWRGTRVEAQCLILNIPPYVKKQKNINISNTTFKIKDI